MLEYNINQKIKKCLACGILIAFSSELILCHDCAEKIHANPHLTNEGGFTYEQLSSSFISPSAAPASGLITALEDENFNNIS